MSQAVLLKDFVDINSESINKSYPYKAILYLDTSSVTEGKFSDLTKLNTDDAPSRAKRLVRDGDTVISTVRPNLKHYGYIKNPADNLVASTGFAVVRPKAGINPLYLYYWLTADERTNYFASIADSQTSTFPAFNPSIISSLKIELPKLETQKKIAGILESIDEKIELNRRMIETLEQIGQALFKHHFITNPRAKNWPTIKVGEAVNIKGGGTPSTKTPSFWDGDISWTSPRDLTGKNDTYLLDTDKKITEQGLSKVSSGLLPEGTLLLSSRAPIGYVAIAGLPLAINQGYIAFLPVSTLSNHFMYFWLKQNMDRIKGAANGSTFMEISKTAFRNITMLLPDNQVAHDFDQSVAPTFEKLRKNQEEIQALITLRDTLLPRLISGKIKLM